MVFNVLSKHENAVFIVGSTASEW